jgi:hypothetical protein
MSDRQIPNKLRPIELFKVIFLVVFSLLAIMTVTHQAAASQYNFQPVIDDQLNILTAKQKQQITAENDRLAQKPRKQQIWFISSAAKPSDFDKVNSPLDLETIQDDGGLDLDMLQDAAGDLQDDFIKEYTGYSYNGMTDTDLTKADSITIIAVLPNFKYHVLPMLSADGVNANGGVRNFFLSKRLNFQDKGQGNVMHTIDVISHFVNQDVAVKNLSAGPQFEEVVFWSIVLIIVITIIYWLIKRHNYHGPKRTSFWDSDGDAKYDNGFLDGWYFGENSGDDTFKH